MTCQSVTAARRRCGEREKNPSCFFITASEAPNVLVHRLPEAVRCNVGLGQERTPKPQAGWPSVQGGEHAAAPNLDGTAFARNVFGLCICIRVRPASKRTGV